MDAMIKECVELEEAYKDVPFDKALPFLQIGWANIGAKYGLAADQVVKRYMDWRSKQTKKKN